MEAGAPKHKAELEAETYMRNELYTNTQKGKQQSCVHSELLLLPAALWGYGNGLLDLLRIQKSQN